MHTFSKPIKFFIFLIILIYIGVGIYLYIFQREFIYYPTKKQNHSFWKKTYFIDGEKIEVITLNRHQKNAILYFGGRSESVSKSAEKLQQTFSDYAVYLINYRGYGSSTGLATEKDLLKDAEIIYEDIAQNHNNVSIIGRSLGTGIATHIASRKKVDKLVLVTPYDSILNIAQDKYPIYPISYILKDQYNSIDYVKDIPKIPTLIFLVKDDKTIPFKYSNNLIQSFNSDSIQVKTINNTTHSSIVDTTSYHKELKFFFNEFLVKIL